MEQIYAIELNKQQLDTVMKALGELPLKEAFPVFDSINRQFIAQSGKAEGQDKDGKKE